MGLNYWQVLRQTVVIALVIGALMSAYFMWRGDFSLVDAAAMVGLMLLLSPVFAAARYWKHDRWERIRREQRGE